MSLPSLDDKFIKYFQLTSIKVEKSMTNYSFDARTSGLILVI